MTDKSQKIRRSDREIAQRHPAIDAALEEGLADMSAERLSPPFKTARDIADWQKTEDYRKFVDKE